MSEETNATSFQVELTTDFFLFAKTFTASDDSRPVLASVCIRLDEGMAYATNAFMMGRMPVDVIGERPAHVGDTLLLANHHIQRARRARGRGSKRKVGSGKGLHGMTLHAPDGAALPWTMMVVDPYGSIRIAAMPTEGMFPDARPWFPDDDETAKHETFRTRLNADSVNTISTLALRSEIGNTGLVVRGFDFSLGSPRANVPPTRRPVEIRHESFRAVVMPMIMDGTGE